MFDIMDSLENYTTPDGIELQGTWTAPPASDAQSGFEWAGEWTVTYETFRDMGMAFGAAIILIYMLVVMEFGNFSLPAIIMAPIPLTLVGIIPGHWLFGAEFTATSMIGFIALAGIIVRNSILLVDFTKHEVEDGRPVTESVLLACKARTRPIVVTALALVGGSAVIIFDPIFKGMAISLAFGVMVSTILTLVVIPLGAITVRKVFAEKTIDASGKAVYADLPYDPILEGTYTEQEDEEQGFLDYVTIALSFVWMFVLSMFVAFRDFIRDLIASLVRLIKKYSVKKPAQTITDNPLPGVGQKVPDVAQPESTEPQNLNAAGTDQPVRSPAEATEETQAQALESETKKETLDTAEPVNKEVVSADDKLGSADTGASKNKVVNKPVAKQKTVRKSKQNKIVKKKSVVKKSTSKASTSRGDTDKESMQDAVVKSDARLKKPVSKKTVSKKTGVKKAPAKSGHRRGIRLKSDIDDDD